MSDFNIQALLDEWGARYTPEGQTMKDIKTQIFTPSETEKYFKFRPNDGDYFKSAYATIDEVTQAFQIEFMDKGGAAFQPWETRLGEFKIDTILYPDQLRNSWLGFLVDLAEKDRSKWPIVKWMISSLLIPKSHEEMEMDQAFYGWQQTGFVEAAPTVDGPTLVRQFIKGVKTPSNAAMNGIWYQLIKMVDAGRANVINTGALPVDPVTFCNLIEDWLKAIPKEHRKKMDFVFMSEYWADIYEEGRRLKYNDAYRQVADLTQIGRTKTKVIALDSMEGSDKIWTTPENNRVRAVAKDHDGKFDTQKADRGIKFMSDWKKVLTFDVPEFVYTNDLNNSITAGDVAAIYS